MKMENLHVDIHGVFSIVTQWIIISTVYFVKVINLYMTSTSKSARHIYEARKIHSIFGWMFSSHGRVIV
jgi:hypothetical protein